ncbi:MAG: SDR family oxidoreductase [Candidatus Brevundimonas colombiensis]|uniref:D-xylose 1-dehydrogenase n=1 Tax=Candidatus Brevundimonas colombiensis TaxID=3121376 RepID=A0AAJ5X0M7_9CAUL|nr:SDR family NAD(P)-dependent oxidoreductase [Brevundimonas sp.]WEK40013.1 MAG: SDR family oxidoreductase [Brevundimonas sp.]
MSVDLSGRVALVTGASAGLGRYFALTLARAGAAVVLCARRLEVLEDLAEDIRAEGGRALPLALDLSDASAMAGAFDAAEAAFGTVDILVNNAGVADGKYATRMTLEEVDHVLAINVRAPFLMATEAARRLMAAEMPGRIVNLSSVAAYTYTHKSAAALYATTKAAVVKMTEALAIEWSAQKINVNAIAPGLFRSEMSAGYIERAGDFTGRFPRGRVGEPEFLESTLLYLVDPASGFVTGTTIIVDDAQQGR